MVYPNKLGSQPNFVHMILTVNRTYLASKRAYVAFTINYANYNPLDTGLMACKFVRGRSADVRIHGVQLFCDRRCANINFLCTSMPNFLLYLEIEGSGP